MQKALYKKVTHKIKTTQNLYPLNCQENTKNHKNGISFASIKAIPNRQKHILHAQLRRIYASKADKGLFQKLGFLC